MYGVGYCSVFPGLRLRVVPSFHGVAPCSHCIHSRLHSWPADVGFAVVETGLMAADVGFAVVETGLGAFCQGTPGCLI